MGCAASSPELVDAERHRSLKDEAHAPASRTSSESASASGTTAEDAGNAATKGLATTSVATSSTATGAALPSGLARPSVAASAAPPGDGRQLVLIVWDIENVRLPLNTAPGLSPRHVVQYLKKHFIFGHGRTEYRTVAAVTERSLAAIRRNHPDFVEQVVPDLTLLLASAQHAKRNADVALKKELHHFTTELAHIARSCPGQLSIVLISGDEDFLEAVQGAMQAGFAVQLVTHDTASGALLAQGYSRPPLLWSDFLRSASGVRDVMLPYGATSTSNAYGSGLEAAADVDLAIVEPSRGDYSGSCCVLVTPRRAATDAAALAAALRLQCTDPGAGGGLGPTDPRPLVFEARKMLQVTLKADESWAPPDATGAAWGSAQPPTGDDHGNGGEPDAPVLDDDAAATAATPDPSDMPYNGTAGPGLHDRLADACERVVGLARGYRFPGSGPAPSARPYQPQQQQSLAVLCRFNRVPGPGELAWTLLLAAPGDADAGDVLAALTHLRAAASGLLRAHGVTLAAECMTETFDAQSAEADEAGRSAEAEAATPPLEEILDGNGGHGVEMGPSRRRLPAMPFRPEVLPLPLSAGPGHAAAEGAHGHVAEHPHHLQQQQHHHHQVTAAGRQGGAHGYTNPQQGQQGGGAVVGKGDDGSSGKKKKKKNKKRRKNKNNSVVPL
ncbi:hypothetical protein GPECTOR_7g1151 [Gonium pectorale]|uniref:NYN domain-containing protein n=1 Tax=Gonium pectorale TaxID=33097 RepID=A0A150GTR9_GONPE|nr:hypothetical protein GPECTOR_7g1151 [Gonium pectorale]|eukprot:KXZ53257.1 hypothetical protein GPECTOR_7g1151 [Gonium pectorale]